MLEAFRERFLWPRRKQAYQTLQRGIDRGELPADSDLDLILDSLYGPIYMRFLIRHDKLHEGFADEICALVLQGLKTPATALRRSSAILFASEIAVYINHERTKC